MIRALLFGMYVLQIYNRVDTLRMTLESKMAPPKVPRVLYRENIKKTVLLSETTKPKALIIGMQHYLVVHVLYNIFKG